MLCSIFFDLDRILLERGIKLQDLVRAFLPSSLDRRSAFCLDLNTLIG
jgi:hypothetical protein